MGDAGTSTLDADVGGGVDGVAPLAGVAFQVTEEADAELLGDIPSK